MASPPAHLHTVTLRSQSTAKSEHVQQGAAKTAFQLRQDASAASLHPEDSSVSSPTPSTSSSEDESHSSFGDYCSTPSSSIGSPQTPKDFTPAYGLVIDHDSLPIHPELGHGVRLITARQYAGLTQQSTLCLDTPEHILYPWLHGADQPYTQQAAYFGFVNGARCPTPRFRGLVTLTADAERPSPSTSHGRLSSLISSASIASSLTSASTDSSESAASSATSIMEPTSIPQLCSSLQADDILERGAARFVKTHLPQQVNLRNFRIQASKYATIADIAIYSERGAANQDVVSLAHRVQVAQSAVLAERRARGELGCLEYRVLIISDPFTMIERDHPHLVAVDSNGEAVFACADDLKAKKEGAGQFRNRVDFFEREREEMRALTEASEICPNVFLGNSQDVPSSLPDGTFHNAMGFSICVEAHDQALMSHAEALRAYEGHLSRSHGPVGEREGSARPGRSHDMVHLECISTGQACPSQLALATFIDNIVSLVVFLRRQATSLPTSAKAKRRSSSAPPGVYVGGRKILIHCQDGYTDSSVIALAYVMHDRNCSLPEAYLHLQLTASRSFFVYPSDRDVLERLEQRFERLRRDSMPCSPDLETPPTPDKSVRRFFGSRATSPAANTLTRSTPTSSPASLSAFDKITQFPWFYDDKFDGHFPSRILPFLYLGNLNHATNALMLKQLGITHVVSIGETALVAPRTPPVGLASENAELRARMPTNSLWLEHRLGTISVLDLRGVSDDGIDSIRPSIDMSNAFIEEARRNGGKVLVHCRVGVSRSATLTIAYLMQHLDMDLASAYLLCRSRRLNILIQPTLLFMNALQWFEARLNAERCRKGQQTVPGQLSWPSLANEIFQLNSRYLSC